MVFDRVRDNTRGIGSSGRLTYPQLINLSMNQTLARSINTSAVAILPVLAVLLIGAQFLGATTLQSYGLALFVGLLSGAYSSIFIASPVLCMMKEREDRWVAIAKRLAKRGDTRAWSLPSTPRTMSTQMSLAAAGQVGRAGEAGLPRSVRRHQAQRADPAGLGQRVHQRQCEREWERRRSRSGQLLGGRRTGHRAQAPQEQGQTPELGDRCGSGCPGGAPRAGERGCDPPQTHILDRWWP